MKRSQWVLGCLLVGFVAVGCGEEEESTGGGGGSAGGTPAGDMGVTGGDPVGGTPVGGDPVGGTPVGGDPVGGAPVGGDPVGGDPVGGAPVGGEPVGGAPVGGAPVGGTPGDICPPDEPTEPLPLPENPPEKCTTQCGRLADCASGDTDPVDLCACYDESDREVLYAGCVDTCANGMEFVADLAAGKATCEELVPFINMLNATFRVGCTGM
jgi:hypothetical protein